VCVCVCVCDVSVNRKIILKMKFRVKLIKPTFILHNFLESLIISVIIFALFFCEKAIT